MMITHPENQPVLTFLLYSECLDLIWNWILFFISDPMFLERVYCAVWEAWRECFLCAMELPLGRKAVSFPARGGNPGNPQPPDVTALSGLLLQLICNLFQTPHLVNLNEDPLMSECLLYYIKDGITRYVCFFWSLACFLCS